MKSDKYIPEIIVAENGSEYVNPITPLTTCSICGNRMLYFSSWWYNKFSSMYPTYHAATLKAQLKRAGVRIPSESKDKNDEFVCVECEKGGFVVFECALCEEDRTSDLKKESYGDPPEYLCNICYETATAKVWSEKKKQLYDAHRYDFE